MPLSELILLRHGETDWNREERLQGWTDVPLNEHGREQSRRLARRLAGRTFDALYASDLCRATETARIVGEAVGLSPVTSRGWRELNLGEMEGVAGDAKQRWYRDVMARAGEDDPLAPGAESWRDLRARVLGEYEAVCAAHPDGRVLLVSHGGVLKALIAHLLGLENRRTNRLSLWGNTSVSRVFFGNGHPQLTLLNDIGHLGDALSPLEY